MGQARAGLAGSTVAAAVRLAPVEMHDPARETPATLEQFLLTNLLPVLRTFRNGNR